MARQGAATGSAANDDNIEVGPIGHLQLGGIGQGRNGQGRAGKLAGVGGIRITSYNVCYTKLLRYPVGLGEVHEQLL